MLLFAPPGSAKSTYVSILLPAGISPTIRRIASSLLRTRSSSPSAGEGGFGTTLQQMSLLGITLSEDSKAAARWSFEIAER